MIVKEMIKRRLTAVRTKTCLPNKPTALVLLALLCLGLLAGCAGSSTAAREKTGYPWEENTGRHAALYPWVVHTPSADWYLASADVELMGEESFREGLDRMLAWAEADFADAQAVLKAFLPEEVPAVEIYTDFSGRTEYAGLGVYAAYYFGRDNCIYLYRDWETAACSLLHEYVHYLSFKLCGFALRSGFWAEGLADYVSMLACENRMARAVNFGLDEEALESVLERGAGGPDGEPDIRLMYLGTAAILQTPGAVGRSYGTVSGSPMPMTEHQQQRPLMTACSYYEAACFFEYLKDRYGEDLVFSHLDCEQGDFREIYGRDFRTLFFEWREFALARCEELGLDVS